MVRIEEVDEDETTTVRTTGRVVQGNPVVRGEPVGGADTASSSSTGARSSGGAPRMFQMGPGAGETVFIAGPGLGFGGGSGVAFGGPSGIRTMEFGLFPGGTAFGQQPNTVAFSTATVDGTGMVHIIEMPDPALMAKPRPPVVQSLSVSLEMLYKGGTVSCCIKSQATDAMGPVEPQRIKNFEVEIMPGYKHGTKIKFDRCFPDDELYPGEPKVDVTFVVEEEKHIVFKRKGAHLRTEIKLSKEQLLSESFELPLQLLSGETERIQGSRGACAHGAKKMLKGRGMPVRRAGQSTSEFGDLTIKFTWPMSLRGPQCCTLS